MAPDVEVFSFSRLSRFERCPKSYELHYRGGHTADFVPELAFGKVIHETLEHAVRDAIERGEAAPFGAESLISQYTLAWRNSQLSSESIFRDGLQILRQFVQDSGAFEPSRTLGVEVPFAISVGDVPVRGAIDRVDRLGEDGIEIIDYKTNRLLFTRDEVDASLQMSLYALAAKELWPWARSIKLTFWMLRHGVRLSTFRSDEDLADTALYVQTLASAIASAREFPARPNVHCVHCDHKGACGAYADALAGKRSFASSDATDLEAVGREREEVARIAKIAFARKDELDRIIKEHLKTAPELRLAGTRYTMLNTARVEYPLSATVALIANATGLPEGDLLPKLATIDRDALEALLKALGAEMPKPRLNLLRAEVDAIATKTYAPRLWSKEVA